MQDAQRARIRVVFHGRVQGVGFRFTTLEIARGFDVVGYVRNCPDGTVELEAEGAPPQVEAFVDMVADRMASNIQRQDRRPIEPTGRERSFDIRM